MQIQSINQSINLGLDIDTDLEIDIGNERISMIGTTFDIQSVTDTAGALKLMSVSCYCSRSAKLLLKLFPSTKLIPS